MDGEVTPFTRLTAPAARMLAVETLLADPEDLGDDVLESCLYLYRDRLRGRSSLPDRSDPGQQRDRPGQPPV